MTVTRPEDSTVPEPPTEYRPPMIERLGTLAELTQGGSGDIDDGVIGAGEIGSI